MANQTLGIMENLINMKRFSTEENCFQNNFELVFNPIWLKTALKYCTQILNSVIRDKITITNNTLPFTNKFAFVWVSMHLKIDKLR